MLYPFLDIISYLADEFGRMDPPPETRVQVESDVHNIRPQFMHHHHELLEFPQHHKARTVMRILQAEKFIFFLYLSL